MSLSHLLAAEIPLGNITGQGYMGNITSHTDGITKFADIISKTIGVLTIGGTIWFIFNLVMGSIAWIGSGGDKQSLQTAQKRITNALIGLLITMFSFTIISLVSYFLGFDFLNIQNTIELLRIT